MLNPNESITAAPIPLKITAHLTGTSRSWHRLPANGTAVRARETRQAKERSDAFKDFWVP